MVVYNNFLNILFYSGLILIWTLGNGDHNRLVNDARAEEPVKTFPDYSESVFAAAEPGYTQQALETNFQERHTLNVGEYLNKYAGSASPKFASEFDQVVIVRGSEQELEKKIAASYLTVKSKVNINDRLFYKAIDSQGKRHLILSAQGEEDYLKAQLILKASGVPSKKVLTTGKAPSYKRVFEGLNRIGEKPDLLIYGFSNSVLSDMMKANEAVNGKFKELQKAIYDQKHKAIDLQRMTQWPIIKVDLENGKKVWLLPNLYGDQARDLFEEIRKIEPSRVLALGTTGSVNQSKKIGDVVIPKYFRQKDGFEALDWIKQVPGISQQGVHQYVPTPLYETSSWLKKARKSRVDTVDVEMKYIFEEMKHSKSQFTPLLVVSDVISVGSKQDLSQWSISQARDFRDAIKKIILDEFKFRDSSELKIKSLEVKYFGDYLRNKSPSRRNSQPNCLSPVLNGLLVN